jgi:hypothetical protein
MGMGKGKACSYMSSAMKGKLSDLRGVINYYGTLFGLLSCRWRWSEVYILCIVEAS